VAKVIMVSYNRGMAKVIMVSYNIADGGSKRQGWQHYNRAARGDVIIYHALEALSKEGGKL
jgi:hypothetical protein